MNNDDDSASRLPSAASKRLKRDDFPHQPSEKHGSLPLTLSNVRHLLREYDVSAGWDLIRKQLVMTRDGWAISEEDLTSLGNLNGLRGPDFWAFVHRIAHETQHNAIRDWIESEPWDGVDRLAAMIATIVPAPDYPEGLAATLIRRWLLGLVAAGVTAGGTNRFSMRGVLTLQGGQGIGKTSWFASLVPEGFLRNTYFKRDHHMDGGSKDSILGAIIHWLVEIGELDGAFRRDIARLKGVLPNDCDKVRVPYGRKPEEFPRTTVFGASVNDDKFLVDPTGNSRFWTISVIKIDYLHPINLLQLYAQLAVMLSAGEQWWLTPEEEASLSESNRRHMVTSAVAEKLADHLDSAAVSRGEGSYLTAMEVLSKLSIDRPSNAQCKEMGAALRQMIGQPKRVQGRDKWRAPILEKGYFTTQSTADDEIY